MENPSDQETIIRIKNGEIDNFSYIVKKYTQRILNYVNRKLYNKDDVEDVVQNAFLHFYQAIDNFDEDKPILPYLFQIVKNEIKMYLRSRKKTVTLDESIVVQEEAKLIDTADVSELLKSLSSVQRKVLQWVSEGYSYQEIADRLKKPINTVRTIIRRARLQLIKKKNHGQA